MGGRVKRPAIRGMIRRANNSRIMLRRVRIPELEVQVEWDNYFYYDESTAYDDPHHSSFDPREKTIYIFWHGCYGMTTP